MEKVNDTIKQNKRIDALKRLFVAQVAVSKDAAFLRVAQRKRIAALKELFLAQVALREIDAIKEEN